MEELCQDLLVHPRQLAKKQPTTGGEDVAHPGDGICFRTCEGKFFFVFYFLFFVFLVFINLLKQCIEEFPQMKERNDMSYFGSHMTKTSIAMLQNQMRTN